MRQLYKWTEEQIAIDEPQPQLKESNQRAVDGSSKCSTINRVAKRETMKSMKCQSWAAAKVSVVFYEGITHFYAYP